MPAPRGRGHQSGLALGLFLATSLALFGGPVLPHFGSVFLGNSSDDPKLIAWMLTWWPHALAHGLNPLYPHVVWAPAGFNLAWGTGVPGPALLLSPVTAAAGPIASYNILAFAGPALSAFTAFLLCRYLTGAFWPSVAGGYLFGFSTYEVGELQSHLNLYLVFLVPLAALLVLKHHRGEIGTKRFVVLLTLCLAGEFSIATEIFATLVLFGAVAVVIGLVALKGDARARLRRTAGFALLALALTAVVVTPFLYAMAKYPEPVKPFQPVQTSSDLLGFVLPADTTWVGHGAWFNAAGPSGSDAETDTYVGPVLLMMSGFAIARRKDRATWWLVGAFLAFIVLSMGPKLKLLGHPTVVMPWRAALSVPLIGHALPARFTMFAWLVAGVAVAKWLAAPGRAWRWGLVAASVVLLLPNLPSGFFNDRPAVPVFFTDGTAARVLPDRGTVMVIGDSRGDAMLWQAESWMAFSLPFGYLGLTPPGAHDAPLAKALSAGDPPGIDPKRVLGFIRAHSVRAILVTDPQAAGWRVLLGKLGMSVKPVDGVFLAEVR